MKNTAPIEAHPQLKNETYQLKKSIQVVKKCPDNFTLLKRFIKEMQLHSNTFTTMYNREVI